jgi:hypothetical protein
MHTSGEELTAEKIEEVRRTGRGGEPRGSNRSGKTGRRASDEETRGKMRSVEARSKDMVCKVGRRWKHVRKTPGRVLIVFVFKEPARPPMEK